jgi:hypothetical protein
MVLRCTYLRTKGEAGRQLPFRCATHGVVVCQGCAYVCHGGCLTQQLREGVLSCPCAKTGSCKLVSTDEVKRVQETEEVRIVVLANQDHVVAMVSDGNSSATCAIS